MTFRRQFAMLGSTIRFSPARLNLHFASKDDVLLALRDRFVCTLLEDLKKAIWKRSEGDWKGKLGAWAQAGIAYFLEEAAIHDLVFREYLLPSPKGQSENIVILHLCDLLEAGTAAGAWSVDDHRFTAIFLFHGLHGVVHDALAKENRVARNLLVAKLQQTCYRAVRIGIRASWLGLWIQYDNPGHSALLQCPPKRENCIAFMVVSEWSCLLMHRHLSD